MYLKIKRIVDIVLSIALLIVFSIPMIIISILIKLDDRGSIFYKSQRMGKGLKPFYIYKFRSMRTCRKELDGRMKHEEMVTRVGKVIRKTSLDELPQLFNILKGDMSFIGPRPWILDYYKWFTPEQSRRCDVLPGLTGLAQAKGRNGITIFEKINYDIEYVDNICFKNDLKIIFISIKKVLEKSDAEITEEGIKEELRQLKDMKNLIHQ